MPAFTGTSLQGNQLLFNNQLNTSTFWSIQVTNRLTLPPQLRGYFSLVVFNLVPNPDIILVVERGKVFSPGIVRRIPIPNFGTDWRYRLEADWNQAGLTWVASID